MRNPGGDEFQFWGAGGLGEINRRDDHRQKQKHKHKHKQHTTKRVVDNGAMSNPPLQVRLRVLTVGDGDLTLSLALARAYGDQIDLTASTLDSKEELLHFYPDAVVDELQALPEHVNVRFQVDATQIHCLEKEKNNPNKWDLISFHHPHLGLSSLQDEAQHAHRHYCLLSHYLHAAKQSFRDERTGLIHVCLCGTQPETWRLMQAAEHEGLELIRKLPTQAPFHRIWQDQDEDYLSSSSFQALPALAEHAAPRRYRNGKLGTKHVLGKYGYKHRRTEGGKYSGSASDMNVSGSVHFVFGNAKRLSTTKSMATPSSVKGSNSACEICLSEFATPEELQAHLDAPALPMVHLTTTTALKSTDNIQKTKSPPRREEGQDKKTINDSQQREQVIATIPSSVKPEYDLVVSSEYDGKRLRWFVSHEISSFSRRETDDRIKIGRVMVNGEAALDTSRILSIGDTITIYPIADGTSTASLGLSGVTAVEIVKRIPSQNLLVAWKPSGMRTKGMFGATTLEYAVSKQEGIAYVSLTKMDTGCPGLCVLQDSVSHHSNNKGDSLQIQHVLTALVHKRVPDLWCDQPLQVEIPVQQKWGKRKRNNDGEDDASADVPQQSQIMKSIQLACTERTTSDELQLSTVSITSTNPSSGSICLYLRSHGYPVVGDRFCKREYISLKRSIRNRIKDKLCLGCYRIRIYIHDNNSNDGGLIMVQEVSKQAPDKLSAKYWETNFSGKQQQDNQITPAETDN
jgi:hypothetical protein